MSYRINPDAYCEEQGCTNPRASGLTICLRCRYAKRMSERGVDEVYASAEDTGVLREPDPFVLEMEECFKLDVVEPRKVAPTIPGAYVAAMEKLDRIEDGSKIREVGDLLGVDGKDLAKLTFSRVDMTMKACSEADEEHEQEDDVRLMAGHLYALAMEMFSTGLELGRAGA